MNMLHATKNNFTSGRTLGAQFMQANLWRDTQGASVLSKNMFKPFYSSLKGINSFVRNDEIFKNFLKGGAGFSSKYRGMSREGQVRSSVGVTEYEGMPKKIITMIDNLSSAFEYGTRIGEFELSKKNNSSDMDAAYEALEISTNFSVTGSNGFITGFIRTVPFLNAMIQSQDRLYREIAQSKKYDGNPVGVAMRGFIGITLPALLIYMINKDDEDYKEIPDYERFTNLHFKTNSGRYIKSPLPYDVGFTFATIPMLIMKYIEDDKGKDFADGLMWTMAQMYGVDGVPAFATGWWDIKTNKKWTGAFVVPKSLEGVDAPEQYTTNTSETFVKFGKMIGVSPIEAEHVFNAYTGYIGGYINSAVDYTLWDEEIFGEIPDKDISENIFLQRFLTPKVRPNSSYMEKFFDLKEESDMIVKTYRTKSDIRRAIKTKKMNVGNFEVLFGLTSEEKEVLFTLNESMNNLTKLIFGKGGIKDQEIYIKYNKDFSGAKKRKEIDELWERKNEFLKNYYKQAESALIEARKKSKQIKGR
jgi:hypothetical protein